MLTIEGAMIPTSLSHKLVKTTYDRTYEDYCLRVGRVVKTYDPTDQLNFNKKFVEYDVEVDFADKRGPYIQTVYSRCVVSSMFGSVADYVRWTPRVSNFDVQNQIYIGSRVLILCINGNSRFGYILAGIPNPDTAQIDEKFENNIYYKFEFNGLKTNINNDGDYIIVHRGATEDDGTLVDTSTGGGYLAFLNDDAINLAYNDGKTSAGIFLNRSQDEVTITGDAWTVKTNVTSINSPNGLIINSGSEAFVNGTTYRSSESTMNNTNAIAFEALFSFMTAAGAALTATAPLLLIPVAGPIAASPFVAIAGTSLTGAAAAFQTIQQSILTMESLSEKFLSLKCFFDDTSNGANTLQNVPKAVQTVSNDIPKTS